MFSPPHTCQASTLARIPAEPQYWTENLPVGHGRYNSVIFTFLPLGFARSGSNNAQAVVYTAQMITIIVINIAVYFNITTARVHTVGHKIAPMASYGAWLGYSLLGHSDLLKCVLTPL